MVAVVEHVRQLRAAGVTLYCWSAGGADYSRRTARELGIESLFAGFLPKPNVLVDDQPPSEWPNCIVAVPSGLASATVRGHLEALARRERGGDSRAEEELPCANRMREDRARVAIVATVDADRGLLLEIGG